MFRGRHVRSFGGKATTIYHREANLFRWQVQFHQGCDRRMSWSLRHSQLVQHYSGVGRR